MPPAFSSPRQALAFAALLLALIALPAVGGRAVLPSRRAMYSSLAARFGPWPFMERQIFEEKGEIDIAFIGSSHLWSGIDTPAVQAALQARTGRESQVVSFGWPWPGFDAVYFIARDLLAERPVRLLVIHDEFLGEDVPHRIAHRWFRYADDAGALPGLPLSSQAALYGGAVLGMPRQLLSRLRDEGPLNAANPRPSPWQTLYRAPDPGTRLGALTARVAYGYDPAYTELALPEDTAPSDAFLHAAAPAGDWQFSGRPTGPYQLHFARQIAALARAHGTRLVFLHLPAFPDTSAEAIVERENWAETLKTPVDLAGIPPRILFAGISASAARQFFYDEGHLNENGQRFFTRRIIPTLLRIHASAPPRP